MLGPTRHRPVQHVPGSIFILGPDRESARLVSDALVPCCVRHEIRASFLISWARACDVCRLRSVVFSILMLVGVFFNCAAHAQEMCVVYVNAHTICHDSHDVVRRVCVCWFSTTTRRAFVARSRLFCRCYVVNGKRQRGGTSILYLDMSEHTHTPRSLL